MFTNQGTRPARRGRWPPSRVRPKFAPRLEEMEPRHAPAATTLDVAFAIALSAENCNRFVNDAFVRYLHRGADAGALSGFAVALQRGLWPEQVETYVIGSGEYAAKHGGGAAWVTNAFQDLLGRSPSAGESAGYVQAMNAGTPLTSLAWGIAASAERIGLRTRGEYGAFLHRAASASEVTLWVNAFYSAGITEVLQAGYLVGSAESFNAHGYTHRDWLLNAYQDLLGREADEGGRFGFLVALGVAAPNRTVATLYPNGTLLVCGTMGSDTIRIEESGGVVTVVGVGTYPAGQVARVQVDPMGGSNYVDEYGIIGGNFSRALTKPSWVYGGSGSDVIYGGKGADTLYGGPGNDAIFGGPGVDNIYGEAGDDYLRGGDGDDYVLGGDGNDTVIGDSGSDLVEGQNGNDLVFGDYDPTDSVREYSSWINYSDRLFGGAGNDALYGQYGNDYLYGEDGNDGLFGGEGADQLWGDDGADRFLYQSGDTIRDRESIDARIPFINGTGTWINTDWYSAGTWTDDAVYRVDAALAALHARTNNTTLLKKADGMEISFVRFGTGPRGFNDAGKIALVDWIFADSMNHYAEQYVVHEVGHNWDNENPLWTTFLTLSNWRQTNPNSSLYTQINKYGETWWYLTAAPFASDYAKTHPLDDYADSFAAYFVKYAGWAVPTNVLNPAAIPTKLAVVGQWLNMID
jgi:hypothetical protein